MIKSNAIIAHGAVAAVARSVSIKLTVSIKPTAVSLLTIKSNAVVAHGAVAAVARSFLMWKPGPL